MRNSPGPRSIARLLSLAASAVLLTGCGGGQKQSPDAKNFAPRYQVLPAKEVPEWLRGSIAEQVDLIGTEPQRVSNYGLVVGLNGTGDAQNVSNNVREYMLNEMTKRGWGSPSVQGEGRIAPELVLQSNRVAIVRVDAFLPPGARLDQRIDVLVSALDDNDTTSLAGGTLYMTDLAPRGADPRNPGNIVEKFAIARGPIFVNPAYALDPDLSDPGQRRSLRTGVVMDGGLVRKDRPLGLRVRSAERRMSRGVEKRLDMQFHSDDAAAAQDEGFVHLRVPARFGDDWEHFAGVAMHTFFVADDQFAVLKAQQIADAARAPDAPLLNMSYAWEALGSPALPVIEPLMTDANPLLAFAAARAAAFIGSYGAQEALLAMARDERNPLRTDAVLTLGRLENSPAVNAMLRQLLDVPEASVRIAAYEALVRNRDTRVISRAIGDKFMIDVIPSQGPALVYATRLGTPRIALFGPQAELNRSIMFTAADARFSISRSDTPGLLTLFFRGAGLPKPVQVKSRPDLAEVIARLGGEGPVGSERFDFNYGQVVALLSGLAESNQIVVAGKSEMAGFLLQDLPAFEQEYRDAPLIPDGPRPITDDTAQADTIDSARGTPVLAPAQ